jgi:hypothetical protein
MARQWRMTFGGNMEGRVPNGKDRQINSDCCGWLRLRHLTDQPLRERSGQKRLA